MGAHAKKRPGVETTTQQTYVPGTHRLARVANWRGRFDAGTYPAGVAPGVYIIWPGEEDRVFHSASRGSLRA